MSTVRTFEVSILAVPGESVDETRQRLLDALQAGALAGSKDGYFDFGVEMKPPREDRCGFERITTYSLIGGTDGNGTFGEAKQ